MLLYLCLALPPHKTSSLIKNPAIFLQPWDSLHSNSLYYGQSVIHKFSSWVTYIVQCFTKEFQTSWILVDKKSKCNIKIWFCWIFSFHPIVNLGNDGKLSDKKLCHSVVCVCLYALPYLMVVFSIAQGLD